MRAALLLLVACGPVTAVVDDGDTDDATPVRCDTRFDAVPAWTTATDDYGMIRGASAFDGGKFIHVAGAYDTRTRTWDVAAGVAELVSSEAGRMLVALEGGTYLFFRGSADGTAADLEMTDGLLDAPRARIPGAGVPWLPAAVSIRSGTIALLRCEDTEHTSLTTFDLDARETGAWGVDTSCATWSPQMVDVSPSGALAVLYASGESHHATLLDLASGEATALADHGTPVASAGGQRVLDVGFSPDGGTVVTVGGDGRLLMHDVVTAEVVGEWDVVITPVNRSIFAQPDTRGPFAFSSDGALLAYNAAETVVVERMCDGGVVAELPIEATFTPAWSDGPVRPAVLRFAPDDGALIAVYEVGVQAFLVE